MAKYKWNTNITNAGSRETINRTIKRMEKAGYHIPKDIREKITGKKPGQEWGDVIAEYATYKVRSAFSGATMTISGTEARELKEGIRRHNAAVEALKARAEHGLYPADIDKETYEEMPLTKYDPSLTKYGKFQKWTSKGGWHKLTGKERLESDIKRLMKNVSYKKGTKRKKLTTAYEEKLIERKQIAMEHFNALTDAKINMKEVLHLKGALSNMTPKQFNKVLGKAYELADQDVIRDFYSYDNDVMMSSFYYLAEAVNDMSKEDELEFSDDELEELKFLGTEVPKMTW